MKHFTPHLVAWTVTALLLAACDSTASGSLGPAPSEPPPAPPSPAGTADPTPSPTEPAKPADDEPTSPPTSEPSPKPTTSQQPTAPAKKPSPTKEPASPERSQTFQVWFVRDGTLMVTSRSDEWTISVARRALSVLIAGPSAVEAADGVGSSIRRDTEFSIALEESVASVDLPASFYSGGSALVRHRQAQVVYTLTQYPTISAVKFLGAGAGDTPVRRADYADLLPAIVVDSPVIGQEVRSPVTVSGTAVVFEATVNLRILDESGQEIATAFTTATCGGPCRGAYTVSVPFQVDRRQSGSIQVYEISAKDGSRVHLVDIPVTLTP